MLKIEGLDYIIEDLMDKKIFKFITLKTEKRVKTIIMSYDITGEISKILKESSGYEKIPVILGISKAILDYFFNLNNSKLNSIIEFIDQENIYDINEDHRIEPIVMDIGRIICEKLIRTFIYEINHDYVLKIVSNSEDIIEDISFSLRRYIGTNTDLTKIEKTNFFHNYKKINDKLKVIMNLFNNSIIIEEYYKNFNKIINNVISIENDITEKDLTDIDINVDFDSWIVSSRYFTDTDFHISIDNHFLRWIENPVFDTMITSGKFDSFNPKINDIWSPMNDTDKWLYFEKRYGSILRDQYGLMGKKDNFHPIMKQSLYNDILNEMERYDMEIIKLFSSSKSITLTMRLCSEMFCVSYNIYSYIGKEVSSYLIAGVDIENTFPERKLNYFLDFDNQILVRLYKINDKNPKMYSKYTKRGIIKDIDDDNGMSYHESFVLEKKSYHENFISETKSERIENKTIFKTVDFDDGEVTVIPDNEISLDNEIFLDISTVQKSPVYGYHDKSRINNKRDMNDTLILEYFESICLPELNLIGYMSDEKYFEINMYHSICAALNKHKFCENVIEIKEIVDEIEFGNNFIKISNIIDITECLNALSRIFDVTFFVITSDMEMQDFDNRIKFDDIYNDEHIVKLYYNDTMEDNPFIINIYSEEDNKYFNTNIKTIDDVIDAHYHLQLLEIERNKKK